MRLLLLALVACNPATAPGLAGHSPSGPSSPGAGPTGGGVHRAR